LLPYPLSKEEALKALNTEIMLRLQEAGIAALSDTTVHERIVCGSRYATTEPLAMTWICWSKKSFDLDTRF
jgi:hypothetical protein